MAEQAGALLMQLLGSILNPYLPLLGGCAVVLLSGVLALLWMLLRRQIRSLRRELAAERERTQGLEHMPKQLEEVRASLKKLDERTVPPGGWSPVSDSVHLNRRGQVLKLHRAGHSICEIAANLGISEGEVRLTLKLHGLLRGDSGTKVEEFALISQGTSDRSTRDLWAKRAGA